MTKKRISGAERRTTILLAARRVFARSGFDGAKTIEIAREAQVSEALVYRHFPSKLSLYRAVLRQAFREQDQNWQSLRVGGTGAKAIIGALHGYFHGIVQQPEAPPQLGFSLLLTSLSGDGYLAALMYRRSQRIYAKVLEQTCNEARLDGELIGEPVSAANLSMFHEHIGTMMNSVQRLSSRGGPYASKGEALVRDAVRFCARGIGITDEAISRHLESLSRET